MQQILHITSKEVSGFGGLLGSKWGKLCNETIKSC